MEEELSERDDVSHNSRLSLSDLTTFRHALHLWSPQAPHDSPGDAQQDELPFPALQDRRTRQPRPLADGDDGNGRRGLSGLPAL